MYLFIITKLLLVIGAIRYLFTLPSQNITYNIFAVLVGLSGLFYLFQRDFYLPFLGITAVPLQVSNKPIENPIKVQLDKLPPNVNVIYWGAEPSLTTSPNFIEAYKEYTNSGIVKTDNQGQVTIDIKCPGKYIVGNIIKRELPSHIHYRYEISKGLLSSIFTKTIKC
jgi:hypothetical protein